MLNFSLFSGYVKGLDELWIIGDRFCFDTVSTHLLTLTEEASYIKRNFEVSQFSTNSFVSNDPNVLSRIFNQLVRAFTEKRALPKLIVVVLEDEIIKQMRFRQEQAAVSTNLKFKKPIMWLMREFSKAIESFKDYLPEKAKREKHPHVTWIQPVTNVNLANSSVRDKFGSDLKTYATMFPNMSALRLVQIWDIYDKSLYLGPQQRFTHEGKSQFWRALDKTVRFCDTNIMKRNSGLVGPSGASGKAKTQKKPGWKNQVGKNPHKWSRFDKQSTYTKTEVDRMEQKRFQLPPPPQDDDTDDSDY